MSLEHWRKGQRNILGAAIAGILLRWFGDVPLPLATSVETTLGTPETQIEIKRFSTEARKALEEQGYIIYGLEGQSIRKLNLRAGREFWSERCQEDYPVFEALTSMQSEVAINPEEPFLPGSNNRTLGQQEEMVGNFSKELEEKIPGVKAVIGQAPDYLELLFAHLDRTGDFSFGEEYRYGSARTKTRTSGSRVANIGGLGSDNGLHVSDWPAGLGSDSIYAAPLVVPT